MKIMIIGLDGLDFDFVASGEFTNLKQEEYGKVSVPLFFEGPTTPMIWSSFITGRSPEVHGPKR